MKILYFAWLREKAGGGEEDLARPETVKTVQDLIDWLKARDAWAKEAFADLSGIRVAVDQEYVGWDHALHDGAEIAFFPPVTGG